MELSRKTKLSEDLKVEIARKVAESIGDTILEETDHYMFITGLYEETDNNYIKDREDIIKLASEILLK